MDPQNQWPFPFDLYDILVSSCGFAVVFGLWLFNLRLRDAPLLAGGLLWLRGSRIVYELSRSPLALARSAEKTDAHIIAIPLL